ncbi:S8 family serine peptidase [Runella sp. SP2]|uniref:S8 family peptidase n=1 Tax=Runella sp. SP2 TaxID=2268026 RepID=UPI000F0734F6|nr:S8 family serine peptidase [Runella sp. SP2]AYQ36592.1 hypothetical protein DTQ70_30185 [Runella sp. SP2]
MSRNFTYTSILSGLKPVMWQNQPIYRHFSKLRNHLRQQQELGDLYAQIFAEPFVEDSSAGIAERATWRLESFEEMPQSISELPISEQTNYRSILVRNINTLLEYSQKMLESENSDSVAWGQLINKSLQIPNDSYILCGENKIVLVAWGFVSAQEGDIGYNLRKEIAFNPFNIHRAVVPFEPLPVELNNFPDAETSNQSSAELPQPEITPTTVEDNTTIEKESITPPVINSPTTDESDKNQPVASTSSTHTGETKIIAPKAPWWKRFWWVWLFLLGILFLFRQCGQSSPLPAAPGVIIPIDSTKISLDPDSVRYIASDRLNIALTGTNKDLHEFAKAFKKLYDDDNYQIIYYDTLTYRLQLQVPPNELEKIKKALPAQLKDYQMLIWYEGIFESRVIPSDPDFIDQSKSWYHRMVKAPGAWDYTRGDRNLVVAIIDDGFDLTHPEFVGRVVKPFNVVTHSSNVNSSYRGGTHGTHVAGIALGNADNGIGVSGIAPACRFMPVQVGDRAGRMGSTAIIDGLLYAIHNGASVVNMSLGMAVPPSIRFLSPRRQRDLINQLFKGEEQFWKELFSMAASKNVTIVLAAGNDNVFIGLDPMQRSENTIIVSATDRSNNKAIFSNYGDASSISAPGVQIYSSIPRGRFELMDGTSMAAPIVTGGVALIKSINPTLTLSQIKSLLQQTGLPVATPNAYIGNLIQLDKALATASRGRAPTVECPDVQQKIDSLLLEIEKLRQVCDNYNAGDTLKLPSDGGNLNFAEGRWKSTTEIVNDDGDFVQIFFDFYTNGTGKITLQEADGTQCTAPLSISLNNNEFTIVQRTAAACVPPPQQYASYNISCKPDAYGRALCGAQNQRISGNNLRFNLIKIQ